MQSQNGNSLNILIPPYAHIRVCEYTVYVGLIQIGSHNA